jgi:Protein of unknown function (DUF1549)
MISGRIEQTHPSLGAGVSYGLGTKNRCLPSLVSPGDTFTIARAGYDVASGPVNMASRDRSTSETREPPSVRSTLRWMACFVALLPPIAGADDEAEELWVLKTVVRPEVPSGRASLWNPIDAFIAEGYEAGGLKPVGPADKRTLLRRVTLDIVGLPPTLEEQGAFLRDESPDAY